MQSLSDVLVIGGGAIGLGIAWRLAQRGATVTVIDKGPMAGEASTHAAGLLVPVSEASSPGPFLDLVLASSRIYPTFAEELLAQTGVELEMGRTGTLSVAADAAEAARLDKTCAWLQGMGLGVERLDAAEVREREPGVTPRAVGGLLLPLEGWVCTPKLAEALTKAAQAAGVRLLPGHDLGEVEREGSRITAIRAGSQRLAAGRFAIAAGPWSGEVGDRFGLSIPVFPVRGQLIALDGEPAPFERILFGFGIYLVRWKSGDIIVGSTVERVGFVKEVTAQGIGGLLRAATMFVPGLAERAIRRTWACLRPSTPDERPILARAPGLDNLFIATGHYRNGILLTPITADLMADMIQGKPAQMALEPFGLDRLTLRQTQSTA